MAAIFPRGGEMSWAKSARQREQMKTRQILIYVLRMRSYVYLYL